MCVEPHQWELVLHSNLQVLFECEPGLQEAGSCRLLQAALKTPGRNLFTRQNLMPRLHDGNIAFLLGPRPPAGVWWRRVTSRIAFLDK